MQVKNKSHPCNQNCALTNFLFFKVEKSWKKYFWNTLILAPQDPILRPPMTSQDPKTINLNKRYSLNKKMYYITINKFYFDLISQTGWKTTFKNDHLWTVFVPFSWDSVITPPSLMVTVLQVQGWARDPPESLDYSDPPPFLSLNPSLEKGPELFQNCHKTKWFFSFKVLDSLA